MVDSETEVRRMITPTLITGYESGKYDYVTFTRNACYRSDSNGIIFGGAGFNFSYQGEQNNMLVFLRKVVTGYSNFEEYLYFSKDYKRLNYNRTRDFYQNMQSTSLRYGTANENSLRRAQEEIARNRQIEVYEQSAPPAPQTGPAGPDRMW
jgi:hypothetical protein